MTDTLTKGVGKLRVFEQEVHFRTKQLERRLAMLSIAILVAILGVGVWALSAYNAFSEMMSPAKAAFTTGAALFVICGTFFYLSTNKKFLRMGLTRVKT